MNERIFKIESRAWGQVTRTNGLVRTEDFNEKFAELIVKECADYIDAFNKKNMVEEGIGGAELKHHFGVKE